MTEKNPPAPSQIEAGLRSLLTPGLPDHLRRIVENKLARLKQGNPPPNPDVLCGIEESKKPGP